MNQPATLDRAAYLEHVRADVDRIADLVGAGPLDAPVPACPGWDLAALAVHVGNIHRWVVQAVTTARRPTAREHEQPDPHDGAALAAWLRDGATTMIDLLASTDASAPTWHPFTVARVAGVWPRRQAIENLVHRVDAELAVAQPSGVDAALASDGIDEYLEIVLPRLVTREGTVLPGGSLHLHCTDVPGEWLVSVVDGRLDMRREHAKGDAALRGPAVTLLMRLWERTDPTGGALEVVGDDTVAAAWLALPGL